MSGKLKITDKLIQHLRTAGLLPLTQDLTEDDFLRETIAGFMTSGKLSPRTYADLVSDPTSFFPGGTKSMATTPDKVFARGDIKVKSGSAMYSEKRYTGKHCKTGLEVPNPFDAGRPTEQPSERDYARSGSLFKHLAVKSGLCPSLRLSDHERELLDEIATKEVWVGEQNGEYGFMSGAKALLDDATSGGINLTPAFLDDSVITFPLLSGELFPSVDLKDVPRGRQIEGASIGNLTLGWGTEDGTNIDLFTTDALVTALNTTIHPVTIAVEIGRDFLSDAGVNVGQTLTQLVGARLAAELDKMIVSGNGTTQPTGILNASGIGAITTENGAAGPPTLADYLSLLFSIEKQYRNPSFRCAFFSNDVTYQRSRSIKIDASSPSTDQRPVFGLEAVNSYTGLDFPWKIQNDLSNSVCGFAALSRYRMYRRLGMEIRFESGGSTLARANKILMIARARFGAQPTDPGGFSIWTNGQS